MTKATANIDAVVAPAPLRFAPDATPVPVRRLARDDAERARSATVLLAATTSDRRTGSLQPLYAADGQVERWRIRATTAQRLFGICEDDVLVEHYRRPSVGFCTGVLVADDLVLTAGHCIDEVKHVSDLRVVFDYSESESGELPRALERDKVVSVLLDDRGTDDDWALLRLVAPLPLVRTAKPHEPAATERLPDVCRVHDPCTGRSGLFAVTHPLGMSKRYLATGQITGRSATRVETDLDVYAGSSGSPVFERDTGRLLGIVVSGSVDFRRAHKACLRTAAVHRDQAARRGEKVLPLSQIPADVRMRIVGGARGVQPPSVNEQQRQPVTTLAPKEKPP